MKSLGIIDKNLNWKFGKGHLVVLGDIFDRGSMVTEVLWHLVWVRKASFKSRWNGSYCYWEIMRL